MSKIGVVVVTYNRLDKLNKALLAYEEQSYKASVIVVVNNASTDGTKEYLGKWMIDNRATTKKVVLDLPSNIGGSGGFYEGQKEILKYDVDWVMIADDDAYPQSDYLKGMNEFIEKNSNNKYSVVCGKVLQNGKYCHRGRWHNKWSINYQQDVPQSMYKNTIFKIDFVSYVGIVINVDKLRQAGLVKKEYFIWVDDHEHSIRLNKIGDMVCLSNYTIVHDTENQGSVISWKDYYGRRNAIDMFKTHFFLNYIFVLLIEFTKLLLYPLKGYNSKIMKMRYQAVYDGIMGNLGINKKYRPGWKV